MSTVVFAVPGDIDTISGGYGYDRHLIAELPGQGWQVRHLPLAPDFPFPSAASLDAADQAFAAIADDSLVMIDGLALAVIPELMSRHSKRLAIVGLVHHPLGLETGLEPETAVRLVDSERAALGQCREIIVTSPETARILLADFGVDEGRLSIALPGTEPGPIAKGGNEPPHLLSIGTLIPRKGHDLLIQALGRIRQLSWRATIVGGETADPDWTARLRASIAELGLGERIALPGAIPDSRAIMATADIFVLPSRYEGYGMVFAEAMAQGLPIVACRAGAVPEVVPETAGLLVPADDIGALAEALESLIEDRTLRARLAAGALQAGKALPTWAETAATVAAALDRVRQDARIIA